MLLKKIFSFATLTLIVALTLSGIAAWYSVQGLVAIFAAAAIPIMIMGGSLEVAKVVTTVWLHRYWTKASWQLKTYLVPAVVVLAFLTSMGIFGFLSKAHIEQTSPVGDVAAQVQIIDEKIANERVTIESSQRLLKQMDDAVSGVQAQPDQQIKNRDGSLTIRSSSERARVIRREQAKDRAVITKEIEEAQANIVKFQQEKAPLNSQIRQVEAEVGPIKYIAALIYGDNPDSALLERAVRWVIIVIVLVFDPLALTLVLAAQSSYRWLEEDLQKKKENADALRKEEDRISEDVSTLETMIVEPEQPSASSPENTMLSEKIIQEMPVPKEVSVPHEEPEIVTYGPEADIDLVEIEDLKTEEIKTEGVTFQETPGGYVQYDGKSIQKNALLEMHPEMFRAKPDIEQIETNFGTAFPKFATKGAMFVRVDVLPNKVFKFDGAKWIEVNKNQTDSYLYNDAYIEHLIAQIDKGQYDVDLLTNNEKVEIENYLSKK